MDHSPIFIVNGSPGIPLCFPQSQELTVQTVMRLITELVANEGDHLVLTDSRYPFRVTLHPSSEAPSGYLSVSNDENFTLAIPKLGLLALVQALVVALLDYMSTVGFEQLHTKEELEHHLTIINERIQSLSYQGVTKLLSSQYKNNDNLEVRGVSNLVQFKENWLPSVNPEELFRNMWVSIANVTHGGNRINRVNEPPLVEETDRTLISDYLKINGIWGTPIPETFYQLELGSSNALDVYFDHYHQLLDFASALATNQEHFAQILDRVAVDWFIGAEEKVPEDIDMDTVTASCLEWLASIPMPLVSKAELDLHGWQIRVHLDWVTFGHIGLVKFEFVERLSEVEQ